MMDPEVSPAKTIDSDSTIIMDCSQDTVIMPPDALSPISEKKQRARASTESSQTPPANKLARLTPRATRSSQNPDFAAKQKKFLNRVHDPIRGNSSDNDNSQGSPASAKGSKENKPRPNERKTPVSSELKRKAEKESTPKRPVDSDEEGSVKKRKTKEPTKVADGVDSYCWRCHRDGVVIRCDCAPCPRAYHIRCVQLDTPPDHPWMCPECSLVTQAEDTDRRSRAMKMLSLDQLCNLLRFALNRMKGHEGADDFSKPVDPVQFPQYRDYIVKPMDLSQLERNIKAKMYGSTEAFLADAKWIVHNSIIFNSVQSKFTNTARALLKLCRQEMQHIENCPDCYQNSHTRSSDSWFTEACRRPHILVWAKLKGFPFWPAKVMSVNIDTNQVDVRFFGAHDRSWIPLNLCYLYSKLSPNTASNYKNKRTLDDCLQEVEYHIKRLSDKFGKFEYAPYKTLYDPKNEDEQLLMMLPQYDSKTTGKRGRLTLHHDGARKSLGRRADTPKQLAEKPASVESSIVNGISSGESQGDQPMVFIPGKAKGPATANTVKAPSKTATPDSADRTPGNSANKNSASVVKKRTPLTAAAKKCFAMFKKDEGGDSNSTVRGTVTIERKRPIAGEGDQPDEEMARSLDSPKHNSDTNQSEHGRKENTNENTVENVPVETPFINKVTQRESAEPIKKMSIVDRLQEKLCFTVIEALKDQMTPEEVQAIERDKEIESSPEKTNEPLITPSHDSSTAVVVLHDLRNNKEIMDKIRENDGNKPSEKNEEANSPSDVGSEVETDVSSCGDSDVVINEDSKQKKKKNINNVVQNLKERKSSVDERSDQGKRGVKESNTLMLDDSADDAAILIIDEGESSDSKKSSGGKSDRSRRKGVPAKVHSRSSTSTESSDDNPKSRSIEVLDEASGHFRRSSGENDRPVTITVVTDDEKPQKKSGKEIRSVNISKSLSLSVIKDSAGLEMECVDSDTDEPVIVDSVRKVAPRPTARKTLPNPPRLASLDKKTASSGSATLVHSTTQPPPLVSLRQSKPAPPVKPAATPAPPPRTILPPAKPSPRTELGPAHTKLEEVVQKVVNFVRSTFEEMLKVTTEASSDGSEALKQTHQMELEKLRWQHKQEMNELKHNTDLVVMEIRASMEADKQRALLDMKHKVEMEKEQAISETKRKQWCAFCQKEAQLYCCWNTAYCSYNCQQEHWGPHMNDCRNKQQSQEEPVAVAPHHPTYPQVGYNS